jgi:hypothetical protein
MVAQQHQSRLQQNDNLQRFHYVLLRNTLLRFDRDAKLKALLRT